ncbi:MAG: outer membrane protein [Saprospiraceae bacterium]|jgi:outer membrane protein
MKRQLILFSLLLACVFLQAQEAKQFTLDDAIKYALEHSIDMRLAQINIADANEQIIERRAIGIPQISAGVDYQYFIQIPASVVDISNFDPSVPEGTFEKLEFGLKNNLTASIQANALLFDASYITGLRAAKSYRNYVQKDRERVIYEVKNKIIEAYLPALILEESKKTLLKNINNLENLLNETKALYKEGFVEQLDVDRLALSFAILETEIDNIDRQKELIYNVLKFQMAYPVQDPIVAVDDIEKLFVPASEEQLTADINYNRRPEIQVIDLGLQLNELNIKFNKSGYLPSLSAYGSYQQSAQGDNLFDNPVWVPSTVVGLQLNVPIFDGFEKRAKTNRAKLDLEEAQNQKTQLKQAISLEVTNARTSYISAQQRLSNQKKNMDLADKIYNTTKIKYKEGIGSSLEITQAEQSLYDTQQNYIQARYDLLVAKRALDKALGE